MKKSNVSFEPEFIAKQPTKWVTQQQFLKMSSEFLSPEDLLYVEKQLINKKHGYYLGMIKDANGKYKKLLLKRIFIREFDMKYSVHKQSKKGKELLISNMPLPPVKL
jgi:hypothetical protein